MLNVPGTMTERTNSAGFPRVLCCGYNEWTSPKTENKFPMWLIEFSSSVKHWRSKKDWLLLFRASSKRSPPKAVLKKLPQKAPWKRPEMCDILIFEDKINNYSVMMKKSLKDLDRFLVHSSRDKDMVDAWRIFARSSDTANTSMNPSISDSALITTTSIQTSCRLGQYFCTQENAEQLANLATEYVADLSYLSPDITYLEPSCGHGQIIEALEEKVKGEIHTKTIIGCDLDDAAIHACRKKFKRPETKTVFISGDFLKTTKHPSALGAVVVVIGGPPYTSGAGCGNDIKRDLPELFLQHCVNEWSAEFVAFILPERYRKNPLQAANNYETKTYEMASSTFYFQGQREVTQPSIIQCWRKKIEGCS